MQPTSRTRESSGFARQVLSCDLAVGVRSRPATTNLGPAWRLLPRWLDHRGGSEDELEVLAVGDPELLHGVVEVGLDRADREDETVGDLGVGEPAGGEVHELALPGGKRGLRLIEARDRSEEHTSELQSL